MKVAIITVSTSGYDGTREDKSGPVIEEIITQGGFEVIYKNIIKDDQRILSEELKYLSDEKRADLILTTGGTGFSKTDCTPEATMDVIERNIPGIPEAIRVYSMQLTKRAMLSRAVAGIRGETIILNLPGSPKSVRECLEYVLPELQHGSEILKGTTTNCGRT